VTGTAQEVPVTAMPADEPAPRWLGIDIGGTTTEVVAIAPDGAVLASEQVLTRPGTGLVPGTLEAIAALDVELGGVTGVGIGIPGQVDPRAGTVRLAVNLGLGAAPLPIRAAVEEVVGANVVLENDVRAAALGAHRMLAPDAEVLVFVGLGTGVAAGVVIDGRLHRGSHGLAGEIGHVVVDPDGEVCGCGARGCLETVISGSALRRRWAKDVTAAGQAVVTAAAAGDTRAQQLLDDVVRHLDRAVQWLAHAYGADVIVLGGGLGRLGDPLLTPLRDRLRERADRSDVAARLMGPERLWCAPAEIPLGAVGAAAVADAPIRPLEEGGAATRLARQPEDRDGLPASIRT